MPKKKMTIVDISKEAGVSPATVSRVLNSNVPVSAEKTEQVMAVVNKYNYKQDVHAQALLGRSTRTIGFIIPDITNPHYSTLFYEFENIARQNDYKVVMGNSRYSYDYESDLMSSYQQMRVDGIILGGGRVDDPFLADKYLQETTDINESIPIIALNLHPHMPGVSQLHITIKEPIHELVAYLHKVGCRTMAIIGGNPDQQSNLYDRRHLYLDAARANGIEVRDPWIIPSLFTEADGRRAARELLSLPDIPDTIACMNDIVAAGVLHELHKDQVRVPEDIMLTGFDGHFIAETVYPSITGITFDYAAYAETIFEEFLSRTEGHDASVKRLSFIKIVVRDSTKRVPVSSS